MAAKKKRKQPKKCLNRRTKKGRSRFAKETEAVVLLARLKEG